MSGGWYDAVGWALIHFVWQGALVAAGLATALRALRGASSGTRYAAACVALAVMTAAPLATGAWLFEEERGRTASPAREATLRPPGWRAVAVALGAGAEPWTGAAGVATAAGLARRATRAVEPAVPWIVWGWAAGVALLSLRLLGGWLWVRRLARTALLPAPPEWTACVARIRARLGIRRRVAVFLSPRVSGPALVGWLRPVVLMPLSAASGLTPRQVELVLLHELVHVRRWDSLVNLLQRVAETALFYHPATWWVSARIREEREHCCDDAVAARAGVRDYVLALLALEEARAPVPTLALGAGGPGLLPRVRRLLDPRGADGRRRAPARTGVAGAALVTLAVALAALPVGARANDGASPVPAGTDGSACDGGATGTTLCPALGATVEALLREAGVPGVAIVQDVATGGVLAYAQASRGGDSVALTEPVLPASLWKLALAAVWWERGRGSVQMDCPALLRVGSATVRNGGGAGPGPLAVPEEMLAVSCNTAAVEMTFRLGRDGGAARLGDELRRLGFPVADGDGRATADTSFWASASPSFRARMAPAAATITVAADDSPDALAALALATQGVRVTPLHLSRFLQAVGNGGVMHDPTLEAALAGRRAGRRVMSASTAERLRAAMGRAVADGTARGAAGTQPPGWSLGGKTGTVRSRPAGPPDGWFAGLVTDPAGRPRYTVLVHLRGGGPGGAASTRLAARVARTLALGGAR